MKELIDKKTGLVWLSPEIEGYNCANNPIFTNEDASLINDLTKELNEYYSKQIETYITGGCAPLGNFMLWATFDKRQLYYCFEDGKLVGTSVLTPNNKLSKKQALEEYIKYCKTSSNTFKQGINGYISVIKAQRALTKAKCNNNTDIDYLAVVPPAQGKGVGTRAVSSIVNNPKFFAPEAKVESLLTKIHTRNIASQKIFKRNGFEKCPKENNESYLSLEDYITTL